MENTVNHTDEQLLAQFQEGKLSRHEMIKTLIERYYDLLYVIARKHGLDGTSAEEVITNTFISLPDKIAGYKGKSNFRSYLYLLFRNQLLEYSKRHALSLSKEPYWFDDLTVETPETQVDRKTYSMLSKFINHLSETDRSLLILRYYEQASPVEIAQALNMKPKMVRQRTDRAVRKLRNMLQGMDLSVAEMG